MYKLVYFVPTDNKESTKEALFKVGAVDIMIMNVVVLRHWVRDSLNQSIMQIHI